MSETMTGESFSDKIRKEQLAIMERAFKIEERKILFVIGLLSIGGINVVIGPGEVPVSTDRDIGTFVHIWYLAPFVSVFFDILALLQKYSVRRIGAFLRSCSEDAIEKAWEVFVTNHRDRILHLQADGFTMLTFLASFWMIFHFLHGDAFESIKLIEWIWFTLLIWAYLSSKLYALWKFKKLDAISCEKCKIEE